MLTAGHAAVSERLAYVRDANRHRDGVVTAPHFEPDLMADADLLGGKLFAAMKKLLTPRARHAEHLHAQPASKLMKSGEISARVGQRAHGGIKAIPSL